MVNLILSGSCRCGKTFTTSVELPETITIRSGSRVYNVKLGEHLVITCPYCLRLVNIGNGTRRSRKTEVKNP